LDSSYFLQFAVTSSRAQFNETGFFAFYYEASAAGKMNDFAEPPQIFYVTPAGEGFESRLSYLKVDFRENFFQTAIQLFKRKLT
jgi:hypothetical protein